MYLENKYVWRVCHRAILLICANTFQSQKRALKPIRCKRWQRSYNNSGIDCIFQAAERTVRHANFPFDYIREKVLE